MSGTAVSEGTLGAGMPYLRLGAGPPLVLLPGVTAHHRAPHGMERTFQIQMMKPYARQRQVWWINRRHGLMPNVTMADLARDYADVLRQQFAGPVDVVGVSTGGSVALQLAADHPDAVKRLVIVSSAYRLGPLGREAQRRAAAWLRAGQPRRAAASVMAMIGARPGTRRMMGALGWLLGPALFGRGDPDLLATIDAEDVFDLKDRLGEIAAPTLVVAGDRDAFYTPLLFRETATLIPGGELMLYRGKGHLAGQGRRRAQEVLAFLGTT